MRQARVCSGLFVLLLIAAPSVRAADVDASDACVPGNIIVDGGFETTDPDTFANAHWPASSQAFGTPLCNVPVCGSGGAMTAGPRTGSFWAWFGGTTGVPAESGMASQSLAFPSGASSVTLHFYLWIGAVESPFTDTLVVQVDNVTQATFGEPSAAESGYTQRSVNLTPFANGATHTITFLYTQPANGGTANFNVDDVSLDVVCGSATSKDSVGIYVASSGVFFLRNTNDAGPADITTSFGAPNMISLTGDWNGDGADTIGVYDAAAGAFFLKNSDTPGPADVTFTFGVGGVNRLPLVGDWNGDGTDTIGLYDTTNGAFFLRNSNSSGNADVTFFFGAGGPGVFPLVGDWNGDGTDTIGIYVQSSGAFFVRNSNSSGAADVTFIFGAGGAGLVPVAGDWNNDGSDSVGLYTTNATFFLKNSLAGGAADLAFFYGSAGQTPLAGDWDNLP